MKSVTDNLQEIAASATSNNWLELKTITEGWSKPELKTHGHWDSKGLFRNVHPDIYERESRVHSKKEAAALDRWVSRNTTPGRRWEVSGDWVKGPQNFRYIAKRAAILAGYKLNVEEACDWLMERLAHFKCPSMEHGKYREEVGLLSDREEQWVSIESLFEASAIFFHELEILA